MPYIGKQPTPVPLTASDLDDDIISLAKLASGTDGNLITYDTSGNPVAVATGDDGQILTSAGAGQPCAFEAAAAGGLLQMVHTEIATQPTRSAGTTYADITGLNLTITPASSSNKILITFNAGIVSNDSRSTSFILERDISGGATTLLGGTAASSRQAAWFRACSTSDGNHDEGVSTSYYDSPSTTSAITYTVQWISQGTAWLNRSEEDGDADESYTTRTHSRIWAQEIGV